MDLGVTLFTAADKADDVLDKLTNSSDWRQLPDLASVTANAARGPVHHRRLASGDLNPPQKHGHTSSSSLKVWTPITRPIR
jgi:hypothetical protein